MSELMSVSWSRKQTLKKVLVKGVSTTEKHLSAVSLDTRVSESCMTTSGFGFCLLIYGM